VADQANRPRVTDAQLLQLRSWGASHRQIAAMLGLRRNTVSVRLSRIDRASRAQRSIAAASVDRAV
jgi:DNA-binding NarL/FixJ family response regulator